MKDITIWIFAFVLLILGIFLVTTISRKSHESTTELMTMSPPVTSMMDNVLTRAENRRNKKLHQKCSTMFSDDEILLSMCRTENGSYLTYENGIETAFDIYRQNMIDGVKWDFEVYHAIVRGGISTIICQIVYLHKPVMQAFCLGSDPVKKEKMWIDYWKNRRRMSKNWILMPATIQL